jgi:2-iminobutanoate/2-iminopropanoate deaminase
MREELVPESIAPPAANYAHGVVVDAARTLYTSGVVPVRPDGTVPASIAEQAETVWRNVDAVLTAAGMSAADVVSVTTYAVTGTSPDELASVMAARDAYLPHRAASTLLLVSALARPEWRVEIAVIAAGGAGHVER